MKKILAWDTSSKAGSIAALEWDDTSSGLETRLVTELSFSVDAAHSERLLWGIHQVLESARWSLTDVNLFGVGLGPGSFTGLRIGISTARTLAHTLSVPVVGVSSLAVLARPVALSACSAGDGNSKTTWITVATDACKGELFFLAGVARDLLSCSSYVESNEESEIHKGWHARVIESVLSPQQVVDLISSKISASREATRWMKVGEGWMRYPTAWESLSQKAETYKVPFSHHIQGRYVGLLALESYIEGRVTDPFLLMPRYLRSSDAEVKLKAGLLKRV